jgi:hypothetical protein
MIQVPLIRCSGEMRNTALSLIPSILAAGVSSLALLSCARLRVVINNTRGLIETVGPVQVRAKMDKLWRNVIKLQVQGKLRSLPFHSAKETDRNDTNPMRRVSQRYVRQDVKGSTRRPRLGKGRRLSRLLSIASWQAGVAITGHRACTVDLSTCTM